jgi:hypothetical protein
MERQSWWVSAIRFLREAMANRVSDHADSHPAAIGAPSIGLADSLHRSTHLYIWNDPAFSILPTRALEMRAAVNSPVALNLSKTLGPGG